MGHNTSLAKRAEIARRRWLAEVEPYLVPGWAVDPNERRIVAIKTALGFYERGQEMLLKCRRTDCRRRVEVDFREAVRAGNGDLPPDGLVQLLRCRHWAGCQLQETSAIYPNGVPLVAYLNDDRVLISIACEKCGARLLLPPQAVITRLKQSGQGDGSTGILQLASRVRGPCRKCGGRQFQADLIRPKAPGA